MTEVHALFLPLNARLLDAVTRWQLHPVGANAFAANDHSDFRWDDRVLASLAAIGRRLSYLEAELVGVDSCHVVGMQLHEDLIATLGLERGAED